MSDFDRINRLLNCALALGLAGAVFSAIALGASVYAVLGK